MQNKPLHIISFDNPFPPVYGGVIDVFYKIKALHELGYSIYLHCFFDTNNTVFPELEAITTTVFFYKKNSNPFFFLSKIPFPVRSRFHRDLIDNIKKIEAPIFFEGIQTTMLLNKFNFLNRKKFLRLHNLEDNYLKGISNSEAFGIKKILYSIEALKYKKYQKIMSSFNTVFTLSIFENEFVKSFSKNAQYIPVFHGNKTVENLSQYGDYALYHGDLRLSDNKKAAVFLIKIFKEIKDYPLLIASNNGKQFIEKQIKNTPNISYVTIENDAHFKKILNEAHINVMLSFQKSGTKLKLINSLFNSRFCLINNNMVDDSRILSLCEVALNEQEFIEKINLLKATPYFKENRSEVLSEVLDDLKNAKEMADFMN